MSQKLTHAVNFLTRDSLEAKTGAWASLRHVGVMLNCFVDAGPSEKGSER